MKEAFRVMRKTRRRRSRAKIGWRVLVVYIVAVLATGAVATWLNLKAQDWERTQAAGQATP